MPKGCKAVLVSVFPDFWDVQKERHGVNEGPNNISKVLRGS